MGLFSGVMLGYALTRLTTILEELLISRSQGFIGAGGGIDSMPLRRRMEIEAKYPKWLSRLKEYPRHEVTRTLIKNLQVSDAVGNGVRSLAIGELFEVLVARGYAMDTETFAEFYR